MTRTLSIGVTTRNRPESLRACIESLALLDHLVSGGSRSTTIGSTIPSSVSSTECRFPFACSAMRPGRRLHRRPQSYCRRRRRGARAPARRRRPTLDGGGGREGRRHIGQRSESRRHRVRAGRSGRTSLAGGDAAVARDERRRGGELHRVCPSRAASTFPEIGGYRESFGFYGEEKDLCLRLLDAGYVTVYLPEALVAHVPDDSGRSQQRYLRFVSRNDCLQHPLQRSDERA